MVAGYRVRPLRAAESEAVASWRYAEELSTYDGEGEPLSADDGYWAVEDGDGVFVGYCCFGAEARVPGVEPEDGVVDVGVGMAPEHVGQGRSGGFVEAVLAFGVAEFAPDRFRAVVLDWNTRSLATCRKAGFDQVGEHVVGERRFVVVERPA